MPKKYILIYQPEFDGYSIFRFYRNRDAMYAVEIDEHGFVYEDVQEAAKELVQLENLVGEQVDRGGV